MTVPDALEKYVILSVEKSLRDGSLGSQVIEPGGGESAESSDEDWVEVFSLAMPREANRSAIWAGSYLFQVNCFSRTANVRADSDRARPWELAGKVRALLMPADGTGIMVAQHGVDSSVTYSCLSIIEIEESYLGEGAAGISGQQGVPSGPSNLHAVALTCRGYMVA